jgi:hypothetical protein
VGEMKVELTVDDGLYEKLLNRSKKSNFLSVEEYISYILEQVGQKIEPEEQVMSAEEEEIVKGRLKDLGYLD